MQQKFNPTTNSLKVTAKTADTDSAIAIVIHTYGKKSKQIFYVNTIIL